MRRSAFLVSVGAALMLLASGAMAKNHKVEICHVPPGNPDNARAIRVFQKAVPAHRAHGDWLVTDETCDGIDNDCDGATDEGCSCEGFCGALDATRPCQCDAGCIFDDPDDCCSDFAGVCLEIIIGTSEVALDGLRSSVRSMETNEGNLIADSLRWQAAQVASDFGLPEPAVALQNGGGIRNNSIIPAGPITGLDTFEMLPFSNLVSVVPAIPRDQFKEILENAVACALASDPCGTGRFAQISGFSFVWSASGTGQVLDLDGSVTVAGTRVLEVVLDDGTPIVSGGSVVSGAPIDIATVDFLANGGDQYPFRGAPFTAVGLTSQQALSNYIQTGLSGLISAADYPEGGEGRITMVP